MKQLIILLFENLFIFLILLKLKIDKNLLIRYFIIYLLNLNSILI